MKSNKNITNFDLYKINNTFGENCILFAPLSLNNFKNYSQIYLLDPPVHQGYVNKLAELKTGTVTINVKSLTNFQDTYEETTTNTVTGEKETVKKQNKAQDVTLKVTVDGEQVYKNSVKENNTAVKVDNVSGTGRVQIKVYIDDTLKRTVDMDLSKTTTMTIE